MIKKGKVQWFNSNEGYGFIKPHDLEVDVFVHWSSIISDKQYKTLESGREVEFEISTKTGKEEAINVKPLPFINKNNGKPLVLLAYMKCGDMSTIKRFNVEISNRERYGIEFIKVADNYIIATSENVDEVDVEKILYFIEMYESSSMTNNLIETDGILDYDIKIL